MPRSTHNQRQTGVPRVHLLAVAILLSVILVAGCGGNGTSSTSANVGGATSGSTTTASNTTASTSTSGRGKAGSHSTISKAGSGPLAFAKCMRANGVTNFPDPSTGRGPLFNTAEVVTSSPAFRAAQAKCQKLMGGGLPVPGSTTHPSARTLAKLRRIAVCVRGHGVPQFPDPRTSVPSHPTGYQEISDFDGAILLFPVSMNLQAPAYRHALTACGAPPLGLPH
jgi:hypothetical protein